MSEPMIELNNLGGNQWEAVLVFDSGPKRAEVPLYGSAALAGRFRYRGSTWGSRGILGTANVSSKQVNK